MPDASPETCRNCGETLLGAFCWRCGQEAADFHRPLRSLASDFFENVLNLDSKLLRTVGPLLFKPGRLTREYLAGRRAPYVRPLKLYLLAALLAFGVLALWPQRAVRVVQTPPEPERTASKSVKKAPTEWDRKFRRALDDPRRFAESFTANLPRSFFLLLPVFALLLKLLYLKRGILYLEHLVFALHCHAFAFVVLAVAVPLAEAGLPEALRAALALSIFVYLFFALREVYKDSWLKTGLRFAALIVLYGIVFGFTLFGLMMFTIYRLAG